MQTTRTERNILFLSELRHIDMCERFLDTHPDMCSEGYLVIPLNAEIEYALTKKGIAFQSGKEYRTPDAARMVLGEEWTSAILESKLWSFFTYRGVSLGHIYFQPLQGYINRVLYYTDIVSNVVKKHPYVQRFVVFPAPSARPAVERCLTGAMIEALADVVTHIARESGKEAIVPHDSLTVPGRSNFAAYNLRRMVFWWGIAILNTSIVLVRRQQRMRILASDYWRNLAPALQHLDSAEIILLDRQEAFNAGIANIWKFRMRLLHLDAFSPRISDERKRAQTLLEQEWRSIESRTDELAYSFGGFSLRPLLVQALDAIVKEAVTRTLGDIDDAYALIVRLKPHVMMLRATVSSQTHFSILAQVARARGVPSIEMQHGLMYFGSGSTGKRHNAEYMCVYGPLVQREMKEAGDERSIPVVIGSPRFDVYAYVEKNKSEEGVTNAQKTVFLCIAPMVLIEEATDSYDVVEYFQAIASALRKIPNAHAILKLRSGPNRDSFLLTVIASLFGGIPHTIAQNEHLADLYQQADVVVSGYSTAALEALQCGKPLVYAGLCPLERMTGSQHFLPYVKEGAMHFASSKEELEHILIELANDPDARKLLSGKAITFLAREYAFDGNASERTAAFISSFAPKEPR